MSITISAYPTDCSQLGIVGSAPDNNCKGGVSGQKEGAKKGRYLEMAALLDAAAKDPLPVFDEANFTSLSKEEQRASD